MKRLLKRFVKIGVAVELLLLAAETLSRVKMSHRTRDSKYLFPQFARAPVNQPVPPVQAAVPAQNYGDQTNLDLTSAFRDAPQAGAKVFTDPIHLGTAGYAILAENAARYLASRQQQRRPLGLPWCRAGALRYGESYRSGSGLIARLAAPARAASRSMRKRRPSGAAS